MDIRRLFRQAIKFGLVGVVNTLVDFAVFTVLSLIGLNEYIAQCISYVCGLINSYVMNSRWTFKKEGDGTKGEMLRFVAVNLVALGVSLGVMYALEAWLHIDSKFIRKVLATGASMCVNFIGTKLFVFNGGNKA